MPSSSDIRRQFIDFFVKKHGHAFVPSSPVVPVGDDTLLFANAGMNQFKPYFLGTEKPKHTRVANTQKCIRAGGKHNDLDDVGKDTYHHTFFEMLGNWSFGDYFKKDAIAWAWELLTDVWKLDPTRLHVTVFEGDEANGIPRDDEAAGYWRAVGVPDSHIHLGNKKDNFWEMGETGPCGPCTEVHIDRTPDKSGGKLVNAGTDQVIEIWNNVFIQFNRNPDKSLTPLPAKHVDTGMGFERICAVIQGKNSNYDTDVFAPILDAFAALTGKTYGGKLDDRHDIGFRVVADHLRMATFAICDGARPGAKGRDAVLRSVIRRAERFGYQYFDLREPFLFKLVPVLVGQMGEAFPELKSQGAKVEKIIREEESEFLKTVERGLVHFGRAAEAAKSAGNVVGGKSAFQLHSTYGFPIDMTRQMAEEVGLTIDEAGFKTAEIEHINVSGKSKKFVVSAIKGDVPKTDDAPKFTTLSATATVLGWVHDNAVISSGDLGDELTVGLLLDRTPFYAEQGGQVGDVGEISTPTGTFAVLDTQRLGDAVLHVGRVSAGTITAGQSATAEVGGDRPHTMRNHTATHLLNWALREVLGDEVDQKGSLVDAEKTRFDFTHDKPITPEQLGEIERLVNEKIYADLPVTATIMPLGTAQKIPGLRAVFGEKYPDPVRVLLIGSDSPEKATRADSVEFCGGTHLTHTGQAGFFKILSQEGVAKGVRRLTATTGKGAVAAVQEMAATLDTAASLIGCKPGEVATRLGAMQDEMKKLRADLKKAVSGDLNATGDAMLAAATEVNGAKVVVGEVPAAGVEALRSQMDRLRSKARSAVIVFGWVEEGKAGLMASVTDDLTGKVEAGKLIAEAAKAVGGRGGGRKDMAQAGGPDAAKLAEALAAGKKFAAEKLA